MPGCLSRKYQAGRLWPKKLVESARDTHWKWKSRIGLSNISREVCAFDPMETLSSDSSWLEPCWCRKRTKARDFWRSNSQWPKLLLLQLAWTRSIRRWTLWQRGSWKLSLWLCYPSLLAIYDLLQPFRSNHRSLYSQRLDCFLFSLPSYTIFH